MGRRRHTPWLLGAAVVGAAVVGAAGVEVFLMTGVVAPADRSERATGDPSQVVPSARASSEFSPSAGVSSTRASPSRSSAGVLSRTVAPTGHVRPAPGGRHIRVKDASSLTSALQAARPGTTITMAAGTYRGDDVRSGRSEEPGRFVAGVSGTASAPITLRGSRGAVLDGGGISGGYGLHLLGADHWQLDGFTVTSASKGIVLDGSSHVRINRVRVTAIGSEGVHFRAFSSDNVIQNSTVEDTGLKSPQFGEGVYLGSAVSNWPRYSGGRPDASDRNQVLDNRITGTAAENIDIKEGSTGGMIRGNFLEGSRLAGKNSADSWLDVKGNGYRIDANSGSNTLLDGFEVHEAVEGWGQGNVFENNRLAVRADGVGIWLQNSVVDAGNVIRCSNVVTGAAAGAFATNHYALLGCS